MTVGQRNRFLLVVAAVAATVGALISSTPTWAQDALHTMQIDSVWSSNQVRHRIRCNFTHPSELPEDRRVNVHYNRFEIHAYRASTRRSSERVWSATPKNQIRDRGETDMTGYYRASRDVAVYYRCVGWNGEFGVEERIDSTGGHTGTGGYFMAYPPAAVTISNLRGTQPLHVPSRITRDVVRLDWNFPSFSTEEQSNTGWAARTGTDIFRRYETETEWTFIAHVRYDQNNVEDSLWVHDSNYGKGYTYYAAAMSNVATDLARENGRTDLQYFGIRTTEVRVGTLQPNAPRDFAAVVSGLGVNLSWSQPTYGGRQPITEYYIEQSSDQETWTELTDSVPSSRTNTFIPDLLTAGEVTHVRVLAGNQFYLGFAGRGKTGLPSAVVSVTGATPTVPASPRLLRAIYDGFAVELQWDPPAYDGYNDVDGYQVERAGDLVQWVIVKENLNDVLHRSTTFVDENIPNTATQLHYRVRSHNVTGLSRPTAPVTVHDLQTIPPTPPNAPTNLMGSGGSGAITLTWDPPTTNSGPDVTHYLIEYSAADSPVWQELAEVAATAAEGESETYTHSDLAAGLRLRYRVLAKSSAGLSLRSDEAAAATDAAGDPATPPGAPTNVTATREHAQLIQVTWDAPSDDGGTSIVGYTVERQAADATDWDVAALHTGEDATTYRDETSLLQGDVSYQYRVRAINSVGTGPVSTPSSATRIATSFALADFNTDQTIDADDGQILYYAIEFPELVGDGMAGGFVDFRESLLQRLVPRSQRPTADDALYQRMITAALRWVEVAALDGGDFNGNEEIDANDALILYFAHTVLPQLGDGRPNTGDPAFRQSILGTLVDEEEAISTDDEQLRRFIEAARYLTIE